MEIRHDFRSNSTTNGAASVQHKIASHRCKHCGGSGYKKSKYDGYMHVCSYCSGTGRKLVLTRKYEIKKGPA